MTSPIDIGSIVELGEILKEKNLSAKITYRDGYFRVKLKCQKSYDTCYFIAHESIAEAMQLALNKANDDLRFKELYERDRKKYG